MRGVGVVVDGVGIITTQNFKRITHAIAIEIAQAVPIAIVTRLREFTLAGVDGVFVVVARCRGQTAHARREFTRTVIHVRIDVVVAGSAVRAALHGKDAGPVVFRCVRVEVQRRRVGATRNLEGVTHAVAVRVHQAIAVAVVPGVRVNALSGQLSVRVVVAGTLVQTTRDQAREEVTRPVVVVGVGVVVARPFHRTTGELTRAVVHRRICVVVGRRFVGATVA